MVKNVKYYIIIKTVKVFLCSLYEIISDQPFLHLTNIYDNPEFRKRDLFIQNRNALGTLTKFLNKDNIIIKHFLDDGTNDGLENIRKTFKVLMDAVKKNKSMKDLHFFIHFQT